MTKVTIKSHDGFLIIETENPELVHEAWHQTALGCVVCNTETNLGISKEALLILQKVKSGSDDLGDIDWFQSDNEGPVFGWLGTPKTIFHPSEIEGSQDYNPSKFIKEEVFVMIDNDVSNDAKSAISEIQQQTLDDSPEG